MALPHLFQVDGAVRPAINRGRDGAIAHLFHIHACVKILFHDFCCQKIAFAQHIEINFRMVLQVLLLAEIFVRDIGTAHDYQYSRVQPPGQFGEVKA